MSEALVRHPADLPIQYALACSECKARNVEEARRQLGAAFAKGPGL